MNEFEKVSSDQTCVRVRHVEEGHEYEFRFIAPDGARWTKPHLVSHTEADGPTGLGLAGEHLEEARAFVATLRQGMQA